MTRWIPISLLGLSACGGSPAPAKTPGEDVTVEYIAHAAFRITSPTGHRILIDPYGSRIWLGYDFPDTLTTEAVFITHPHYDHDAGVSRGRAFPWDSTRVPVYRRPGRYLVGDITVRGIEGKHADPYGKEFGQINTIWVVETAGLRIGHWGDNGPITDRIADEMGTVDVLMLPADADHHILSEEATTAILDRLAPRWFVPMHYAIPDLEPGDGPTGLGPIEPWLTGRPGVRRVAGNRAVFRASERAGEREIVVFEPAPYLARPADGG